MEFPFLEANSILGAVSFSIANGPLASGTFIFLTLSPPVSRGIVGYNSGLKFLKAYRWTPPLIDLTADYAAMFGDLTGQEGQRIWYKAQLVSGISGDASAFQQNSCIVT